MFYSRAAGNLASLEAQSLNRARIRLRRIGGFCIFLLAIAFYAGFYTYDAESQPMAFLIVWTAVMLLLLMVVGLGLIDLRLTWRLRKALRKQEKT